MSAQAPAPLPCGRDPLELVAQISDGTPPADAGHQATCAYCQDALRSLGEAAERLDELAQEVVTVPRDLGARVLSQLRREAGRLPLGESELGRDTVSDLVLAQIARRAARSVPGVRACSVVVDQASVDAWRLEMHLTAVLGPSLPALADAVRAAVAADLALLAELQVELAITIDDVELPG